MAGGKLTPRQKMINMMYLVLTALLALNVSNDILKSFQILANSLKNSSTVFGDNNDKLAQDITGSVDKEVAEGNRKNEYIKPLIAELDKNTDNIITYIEGIIKDLEKIGIKSPETGKVTKTDETEENYQYWMSKDDMMNGGRGNGKARELREKLNGFVHWANDWYAKNNGGRKPASGTGFPDICIDPKDDPGISKKDEMKDKPWEYFTFHRSPLIANIAILEKYKIDVNTIEAELLDLMKAKLQQVTFKIDSLIAVDAPISEIVPAGLPFTTRLFVAMSSKDIKPTFSGSGQITTKGNSAEMKIMASGSVIPPKASEGVQNYSATITVPKADGSKAILKVNSKFRVRKPEIQITSAAIQIMYRECGNDINVDVPALGDLYDPVITATSAEVEINKTQKRKVRVIPSGAKTTLTVSSRTGGQIIKVGDVAYNVVPPPRPSWKFKVDGSLWDGIAPVSTKSKFEVCIVADKDFAASLPQDARYAMRQIKLMVGSGLGAPKVIDQINTSPTSKESCVSFSLAGVMKGVAPGSRMYIQSEEIVRVNFRNKSIPETFSLAERTKSATVK